MKKFNFKEILSRGQCFQHAKNHQKQVCFFILRVVSNSKLNVLFEYERMNKKDFKTIEKIKNQRKNERACMCLSNFLSDFLQAKAKRRQK